MAAIKKKIPAKTKKKKKRNEYWDSKYFSVPCNTFNLDLGVFVNLSEEEIMQHARKAGVKDVVLEHLPEAVSDWDADPTLMGLMIQPGNACYMILLRLNKNRFRDAMGTLVHEVHHAVTYILRNKRIPLTIDTEEVHAYLHEELVTKVLDKLYD